MRAPKHARKVLVGAIAGGTILAAAMFFWPSNSDTMRDRPAFAESETTKVTEPEIASRLVNVDAGRNLSDLSEIETDQDDPTYGAPPEAVLVDVAETLAVVPLSERFREQVQTISSEEVPYFRRSEAVRSLGPELSVVKLDALYSWLLSPPADSEGGRARVRALKNDLLNRLRSQDHVPDRLTDVMVMMFEDLEQDAAVRDYAIQHLGAWYGRAPAEQRPAIRSTLQAALGDRSGGIGATALLALRDLNPGQDDLDIAEAASLMLSDSSLGEPSRVSALQVLVGEDPLAGFSHAVQWALDPDASYVKRVSVIAALGASGSHEAADYLSQIKQLEDPHLEPALTRAYSRLKEDGVSH